MKVVPASALASWISTHPLVVFLSLSLLFGPLTISITPPLRGPDEFPHFLRTYGLSTGAILPSMTDEKGHRSVFLPIKLDQEFKLYDEALRPLYDDNTATFPEVLARYARSHAAMTVPPPKELVLVPYAGSEGYSPVPYLPYLPALAVLDFFDLDFVGAIYLMRAVGFVLLTAVMALAIVLAPKLARAFLSITFLPSALFSRAILSADGSALAFTLLVTAASLRSVQRVRPVSAPIRSFFMILCVLSKPPNLIFILLEAIRSPLKCLVRHWKITAIVIAPALVLSFAWVLVSSADVAVWRFVEGSGLPPEHYQPLWRIHYLLGHPLHFFTLLAGTYDYVDNYWRQLIGVLGWLDMPLRYWLYPVLTGLLLASFYRSFPLDSKTRHRVIAISAATTVGYILGIFFIFYLVWTGLDETKVEGVQGRYFVVLLPVIAMMVSSSVKRGFSGGTQASIATSSAILSGWATLDAISRSEWKFSLLPF